MRRRCVPLPNYSGHLFPFTRHSAHSARLPTFPFPFNQSLNIATEVTSERRRELAVTDRNIDRYSGRTNARAVVVVVVVTFFNHNFVNCKATLILAIKIYEIKYNISLNDIHT